MKTNQPPPNTPATMRTRSPARNSYSNARPTRDVMLSACASIPGASSPPCKRKRTPVVRPSRHLSTTSPKRVSARDAASRGAGSNDGCNWSGPRSDGPGIVDLRIAGPDMVGPSIAGPGMVDPRISGPDMIGPPIAGPGMVDPRVAGLVIARPGIARIVGSDIPGSGIVGLRLAGFIGGG